MTTDCDCPFCPIDEFGKEFVNTITIPKGRLDNSGMVEVNMKSDIHLPEKIRKACSTIILYVRNNCKIKHRELIKLIRGISVYYLNCKKSEIFRICFHPEEQPLELVVN